MSFALTLFVFFSKMITVSMDNEAECSVLEPDDERRTEAKV